jgi:hypothetical protein
MQLTYDLSLKSTKLSQSKRNRWIKKGLQWMTKKWPNYPLHKIIIFFIKKKGGGVMEKNPGKLKKKKRKRKKQKEKSKNLERKSRKAKSIWKIKTKILKKTKVKKCRDHY